MRRLSTILLILVAAGCGSDKSTAPKRLEGTYTLTSFDGEPIPMILVDDPANSQRAEIVGGSITLASGGTYSSPWAFRITDHGVVTPYTETCTGTFTRSGNHLTMSEADNGSFCGGDYEADWDGNNSFTDGIAVYKR